MFRFALLSFFVAASVEAQVTSGATTGERAVVVAGALGGGLVVGAVAGPLAPLGIAGGTYGAARLLDLDVPRGDLAVQTAIGTLVGAGVAVGTYWVTTEVHPQAESLGLALTSLAVGVSAAAVTTALRVEARPTMLATPTGESAPGVSLQLTL